MKIHRATVNKRSLIRWKVYFDRSRMYIGYIQFFLIGVVFLQSFKDRPWGEFIFRYAVIAVPIAIFLFVLLSLILGFLDSKLGFREEEMRNMSKSNPVMMEIAESIREIKEKLNSIDKMNKA